MIATKSNKTLFFVTMAIALGVIGTAATRAQAGFKEEYDVVIDDAHRTAHGAMGTVRGSPGNLANVSVAVIDNMSPVQDTAYFSATDASGVTRLCVASDPVFNRQAMVEVAKLASGDSYVQFTWNSDGTCAHVWVETGSSLSPKPFF